MGTCKPCQKAKELVKKVGNIGEAYVNLVITDPIVEEEAKRRILICTPCPNKVPLVKVGTLVFYKCNACGCPVEALIRSTDEHCSLGKW